MTEWQAMVPFRLEIHGFHDGITLDGIMNADLGFGMLRFADYLGVKFTNFTKIMLLTRSILPLFVALPLAFCLNACAHTKVSPNQLAKEKALYERETAAIIASHGATVPYPGLDAIEAADQDPNGYVSMVSYMQMSAATKYYPAVGSLDTLGSHLMWVTQSSQWADVVPDLKLNKYEGEALALRLSQLIGLPPSVDTATAFLTVLVKAGDVFRPCRDAEISDCTCSLESPMGAFSAQNAAYPEMYAGLVKSTAGYPWTSMGYTYDWKKNVTGHYGMSEYIIKPGAVVKIVSKTPVGEYIRSHAGN